MSDVAAYLLAMAMARVGLGTRLKFMRGLGIKPFYVGLSTSLVVGIASGLGGFVQI